MSERKVLNKYYPPDFDPSKIPKMKQQKNKQYTIRTMAPFNMRCNTCADYIYKGRKFNAKCEVAEGENFLGLRIYRFYIRCPKCITEIMFKTDPENTDYTLESGATRLFEAAKLIEEAERREQQQREEDATNPMKMLETRTKDSKLEMDIMENLEDLREINTRKEEVDYTEILRKKAEEEQERLLRQEQEDEEEIKRIFGRTGDGSLKRIQDDEDSEEESSPPLKKLPKASDYLISGNQGKSPSSSRKKISSLIKRKQPTTSESEPTNSEVNLNQPLVDPSKQSVSSVNVSSRTGQTSGDIQRTGNVASHLNKEESNDINEKQENQDTVSQGLTETENNSAISDSTKEGLTKNRDNANKREETIKGTGFGLLVGYEDSDTSSDGD